MSASVELSSSLTNGNEKDKIAKSDSKDSLDMKIIPGELVIVENNDLETPEAPVMAFTIDFGNGKSVDKERLESLAKKSQARYQRVQSMSASWHKPSPTAPTPQKPPLSGNLPRKSHGYNSEGYFSSDQEEGTSGSLKNRKSPAQVNKMHNIEKNRSPTVEREFLFNRKSKSPIVDSIMSRSESTPSRKGLNLPLKYTNTTTRESPKTPIYSNINPNFFHKHLMPDIIDQSPEGIMLCDVSSPEMELLTPDTLNSPKHLSGEKKITPLLKSPPEPLFKKCSPKFDDSDNQSDSSTGTYTIEGDTYTQEQKARMSIDRSFAIPDETKSNNTITIEKDPELVLEDLNDDTNRSYIIPRDRNILEITCCYESPSEDLATQTSNQIKSTRTYLEKIKSRVKNIAQKTAKHPDPHTDVGSFTSVTTSGVLSQKSRKNSLTKSQIEYSEYIHRLSRESSVPVSLPSRKNEKQFESTVLRNAHALIGNKSSNMAEKLSNLSLNRCRGDPQWVQQWAESAKKYNSTELVSNNESSRPKTPLSPRNIGGNCRATNATKIPSPQSPARSFKQATSPPNTNTYLLKTQKAISNLQAKYNITPANDQPSKLPIPQLNRSNSLNYRLKKKTPENSPLRNPGNYLVTGRELLSNGRNHTRHRSYDGNNTPNQFNEVDLKTVLLHNAKTIDQTSNGNYGNGCYGNGHHGNMKRSSSYNTVSLRDCEDYESDSDTYENHVELRRDIAPANSPKYSPKMADTVRKYSPGMVRNSVRVTNKEKSAITQRLVQTQPPSRKLSDTTRQNIMERLTKPKNVREPYNSSKRPQSSKDVEFSNWKKRTTYDPMRAAMEDKLRKQQNHHDHTGTRSSLSPVHRSQSFQSASNLGRDMNNYSSSEESLINLDNDVMIQSDIGPRQSKRLLENRKTFKMEETTPSREHFNVTRTLEERNGHLDKKVKCVRPNAQTSPTINRTIRLDNNKSPIDKVKKTIDNNESIDKRKTFILESDTNSSSPRNSSIFSQEKSLTNTSDTENESGAESAPVVIVRNPNRRAVPQNAVNKRHSGDYSMSSSQTSLGQSNKKKAEVQPRYLDISKYKNDITKNNLKKDTYVSRGSARHIELEQKSKELEKWKRRASYDPRKAAAQNKTNSKAQVTTHISSVLRSQSFHGPMVNSTMTYDTFDVSSDNDF